MKSQTPVKYFRKYIMEQSDYQEVIEKSLVTQIANTGSNRKWNNPKEIKLGEIYFNLFQLITIYNLVTLQKKSLKSVTINQKDMIVEIVRVIDKHLNICFPTMSRENFIETFSSILYIPRENN